MAATVLTLTCRVLTKAVNANTNTNLGTGYNEAPIIIFIIRWSNVDGRRQDEAEQHFIEVWLVFIHSRRLCFGFHSIQLLLLEHMNYPIIEEFKYGKGTHRGGSTTTPRCIPRRLVLIWTIKCYEVSTLYIAKDHTTLS
jgi:hypothetical protein